MKKFCLAVAAILILTAAGAPLSACTARSDILKIYNWGEYMEKEVIDGFAAWYEKPENGGKKITVRDSYFDSNEDMYTQIALKKADFDLACPSDYMAEKMMKEDLLKPLDKTIFNNYSAFDEDLLEKFVDVLNIAGKSPARDYLAPYMWGTMGIMYNADVFQSGIDSWAALWAEGNKDKIYIKDGSRDVFTMAAIYVNKDILAAKSNNFTDYGNEDGAYMTELKRTISDTSDANLTKVREALETQFKLVKTYGSDEIKKEMMESGNVGTLGLFWSCDAGFAMMGSDQNLAYIVPEEGSNIYADYFVIPKYAQNQAAANAFLKYLNIKDNALKNMEYCGAPSFVKAANIDYEAELRGAGMDDAADVFFPDSDVLARCAIMKDLGDKTAVIDDLYMAIRGSGGEGCTTIQITGMVVGAVAIVGMGAFALWWLGLRKKKEVNATEK